MVGVDVAGVQHITVQPRVEIGRGQFQFCLRTVKACVGEQLLNESFELPDIAVQRATFAIAQVIAHLQAITQPDQRRTQLVGHAINQHFLTGDQGVDVIRHLVKSDPQSFKAGGAVKMNALFQMTFAKALGGGFQPQHLLPVGAHPDKHRESQ